MYHPHYQYAAAPAPMPTPRQYSGTSSAFSPSAHPDEDWTKISDLAERRRIQNRIAQRNYRKKLKSRLQELEKRAGTDGQKPKKSNTSPKMPKVSKPTTTPPMATVPTFMTTPPSLPEDVFPAMERDRSQSPMFAAAYSPPQSTYPPLDEQGYLHPSPYGYPVTTMSSPAYLTTTAMGMCSLPAMVEPLESKDAFGQYMSSPYYVPSIDINAPYDYSNPQTPPLSHSFDHSTTCSESEYQYPTTPLSMPSPGMMQN